MVSGLWASRPQPQRGSNGGSLPPALRGRALTKRPAQPSCRKVYAITPQKLWRPCVPSTPLRRRLPALLLRHPLAPGIDADAVSQALRRFPAETAPGPSGLRVQHLLDALGHGGGLLDQLTAVVNLLARGRACASIAPSLAGAGLVALPKPSGGIRPIAVGELLRRLTGKCLMHAVRPEARDYFWPAQAGVAVKGGAEAAVHGLRAWVGRHSQDSVVVRVDFQNAFNTVNRDVVLQQARDQFPTLARWSTWCYQHATHLQLGDTVLQPSSGVQQGDPLGPLLFAAALPTCGCRASNFCCGLLGVLFGRWCLGWLC